MMKLANCAELAIPCLHVELAFWLAWSLWKDILPLQSIESKRDRA